MQRRWAPSSMCSAYFEEALEGRLTLVAWHLYSLGGVNGSGQVPETIGSASIQFFHPGDQATLEADRGQQHRQTLDS